ncbi:ATP-binding protein [Paeniglutamicibacter sp. ZC-3]|uniref:ATP-binding protein n=1 Tax=Paeniglutamicibacter sp. ZC-3 TaxID=2986919 RepID=UPI0021F6BBCE|nr:ATP-binding protein [Paeniglutamicibacter sp. ZC-3]MCV9995602.1 ATP-binding protein [Paeniglutamicibacter sp. ZC-3]
MTLINRIEQALDQGVDHDLFEDAATALLQIRYPWLSPVEAGRDFGRDGDIYRTDPINPMSRGRLLATTGDPLANLKRSHKSWRKEQLHGEFRIDALVIATSKNLTGTARKKLDEYCQLNQLPLPECYGRKWLVNALKNDAEWREQLIGVKGRLDALVPVSELMEDDSPSLLGRDSVLEELLSYVDQGKDVVLTGVAGVGKTRILSQLNGSYLVEPLARTHLFDDLIRLSPRTVVLDDAHLHSGLIAEIAQIRGQEGLTFSIVATCWPDEVENTALPLNKAGTLPIELLPRKIIDDLIVESGVTAIRARRLILTQAEGRVGWALTLCKALVDRHGAQVFSGEALLDNVTRHLRQVSDDPLALDVLACIAALKGATPHDLEKIAGIQYRPLPLLMASLRGQARRGLIENRKGRWHLQKALGAPLISRWFFGPAPSRTWNSLTIAFPERSTDLVRALLQAAGTSGTADTEQAARDWARSLSKVQDWDADTLKLLLEYARLDEAAADFASAGARTVLAIERTPISIWETTYDPIGDAAKAVLRKSVNSWCNIEAVHGLLDLALRDRRSTRNHSDNPLRVLGDLATHLDPDRGTIFPVRRILISYVCSWLRESVSSGDRWNIFGEVLKDALSPTAEGTWAEPAESGSITMAQTVEPATHLKDLIVLWRQNVAPLLEQIDASIGGPQLKRVIELLETWLRIAAGISPGTSKASADQRREALAGSWTMITDLRSLLNSHPGAGHLAVGALDLAHLWKLQPAEPWPVIEVDEEFEFFVGHRNHEISVEEWQTNREKESALLADRLLILGPTQGTERYLELTNMAAEIGISHDGRFLPLELSGRAANPLDWLKQAITADSNSLSYHFTRESRSRGLGIDFSVLQAGLARASTRAAVIKAILADGSIDAVSEFILNSLQADDARHVEVIVSNETPAPIVERLLTHEVSQIRAQTSLVFSAAGKYGYVLPEEWRPRWRAAFLEVRPENATDHARWRLVETLKVCSIEDVSLCAEWFILHLDSLQSDAAFSHHEFVSIARKLPREQRALISRTHTENGLQSSLLFALIGHDAELTQTLLKEGTVTTDEILGALSGERDLEAKVLALALLEEGVSPACIAQRINSHRSWSGEESAAIATDIEWFKNLAIQDERLTLVSQSAIANLTLDYERALSEEKNESIRGRS